MPESTVVHFATPPTFADQQRHALTQVHAGINQLSEVAEGIAALRERYAGLVFNVTTKEGMQQAREARAAIRDPRYKVESIRKGAKAPILDLGRKLDDEAKRITGQLLEIEEPINAQIRAEEERIEELRQAEVRAEQERVAGIQKKIAALRELPIQAVGRNSKAIANLQATLSAEFKAEDYAEFKDAAVAARSEASGRLATLYQDALRREDEAARIAREQEDLARKLAEIEKAQAAERAEREAREAAEREAQRAREAELAAREEQLRAEREAFQRQQEEARKAKEPPASPAEVEADDHANRDAGDEHPVDVAPPRPLAPVSNRPTEEEIIVAVATHFSTTRDCALAWLRDCEFHAVI